MSRTEEILNSGKTSLPQHSWTGSDDINLTSKCIHEIFKEKAQKTPGAIALTYKEEQLTYQQLDVITDSFAKILMDYGIGPDKVVCIFSEKSLRTIATMLAVLKAGGCYLALDQDIPQDRLNYIIEDACPNLIITTEKNLHNFGENTIVQCINLDVEWDVIRNLKLNPKKTAISNKHLAYISYTSGTTGKPKGVCVTHSSIARLVIGENSLSLGSDTVFLQLAPIAFDASTLEIWGTLTTGGELVVYANDHVSPEGIREVVEQKCVNTLWLTAGLFHMLVDTNIQIFKKIKHVIAGGDVVSAKHVKQLIEKFPLINFTNGYGPTENTTFTTTWTVQLNSNIGNNIPIGTPINGTTVYILDTNLSPAKVGETGDLYTGGEGLARCYLQKPKETAAKFIPNPFSLKSGARMYKTGDQVRWNNNGTIDFIGRKDKQLKINGYRVEPSEIEEILKNYPKVLDAVVVAQQIDNEKRLLGYVTLKQNENKSVALTCDIQDYLKEKLPTYMIPWLISIIESIPLTKNGKVDREALPKILKRPRNMHNLYVSPSTSLEIYLTELWQDMLKVDVVGIEDDFFELGGHSLIVAQLVSQIRIEKEVKLHSRILYLNPTIKDFAYAIESENKIGGNYETNKSN